MKDKKTSVNLYKLIGETIVGKDNGGVNSNVDKVKCVYMPKKRVIFASTLLKPSGTC